MISLFKFDKKIKSCHLFFPENASDFSIFLSAYISRKFKIECNCINYKIKLSPECVHKIRQELNTNGIFLIAYQENFSPENYYKLGLVNAHNKTVILVNLSRNKNQDVPKYILNYVEFRLQLNLIEKDDQGLLIDKNESGLDSFLESLDKILKLLIINDLDSILYQKAIEYCQDLERDLHSDIEKIDKKVFSCRMSEGDTRRRLRYSYWKNDQRLFYELINLVIVNKREIYPYIQPLINNEERLSRENKSMPGSSKNFQASNIQDIEHNYLGTKEQNRENHAIFIYGDVHGDIHGSIKMQNSQQGDINKEIQVVNHQQNIVEPPKNPKPIKSAWVNGSFYLFCAIVMTAIIGFLGNQLSFPVLCLVIIAVGLLVPIIGALQLKQDDRLKDETFLSLMKIAMTGLPFIGKRLEKALNSADKSKDQE